MSADVLVLRPLGLGDLLTAVPALRAVRRALPTHRLVLAAPAALGRFAARAACVDAFVHTTDDDRALAVPPPRIAIDMHGAGPSSLRRLLATAPGRVVAFDRAGAPCGSLPWVDRDNPLEHETERWCRLVRIGLGAAADATDLALSVDDLGAVADVISDGRGVTIVHPGASAGSRRWPPDRWAEVARSLTRDGHRVVVTGGRGERALAAGVAKLAGLPESAVLAGRTSLDQLAKLVAGAALVTSGDTGIAHLASAYRRPSVVLFGPVDPALWGPPCHSRHAVVWHGLPTVDGRPGDAHGAQLDPRLAQITVAEVLASCAAVTHATAGEAA